LASTRNQNPSHASRVMLAFVGKTGMHPWKMNRVRAQRKAVEAIEAAGGGVQYDYQNAALQQHVEPVLPAPARWIEVFGIDFFADVTGAWLGDSGEGADCLFGVLPDLPKVTRLNVWAGVSDVGIGHIARLQDLEGLIVVGSFSDSGVSELGKLAKLHQLTLSSEYVTGIGFAEIAMHCKLEYLNVTSSQLTDEAIGTLRQLTKLKTLEIGGSRISYAGVDRLQDALPGCRVRAFNFVDR